MLKFVIRILMNVFLGIKIVMKMAEETNTFKTIDAKFGEKHFPGCEQHALKSDAYYECYVRHLGMTLYHRKDNLISSNLEWFLETQ